MSAMTSGLATRRARLGKTVTTLRRQRRLTVESAAARAGMSSTTWQRVEDGLGVRSLTYRGVEEVFGLRRLILDELLNGTADWSELDSGPKVSDGRSASLDGLPAELADAIENMIRVARRSDDDRRSDDGQGA